MNIQNFEHDKALLKERLRKVKENEKRLEREKKRLDIENEKNQKKLKELNNIIQTKETFKKFLWPILYGPGYSRVGNHIQFEILSKYIFECACLQVGQSYIQVKYNVSNPIKTSPSCY